MNMSDDGGPDHEYVMNDIQTSLTNLHTKLFNDMSNSEQVQLLAMNRISPCKKKRRSPRSRMGERMDLFSRDKKILKDSSWFTHNYRTHKVFFNYWDNGNTTTSINISVIIKDLNKTEYKLKILMPFYYKDKKEYMRVTYFKEEYMKISYFHRNSSSLYYNHKSSGIPKMRLYKGDIIQSVSELSRYIFYIHMILLLLLKKISITKNLPLEIEHYIFRFI